MRPISNREMAGGLAGVLLVGALISLGMSHRLPSQTRAVPLRDPRLEAAEPPRPFPPLPPGPSGPADGPLEQLHRALEASPSTGPLSPAALACAGKDGVAEVGACFGVLAALEEERARAQAALEAAEACASSTRRDVGLHLGQLRRRVALVEAQAASPP